MTSSTADSRLVVARDPAATSVLGRALGTVAQPGDLVCLWGELGAGKTHLAKAFAAGLGVTETVTSPSFVLMAEYRGRLALFHIDPYRLSSADDALAGGLIDERQRDGVTLVEWPERLGDALPTARLDVRIDGTGDDRRSITLVAGSDEYRRYLDVAA